MIYSADQSQISAQLSAIRHGGTPRPQPAADSLQKLTAKKRRSLFLNFEHQVQRTAAQPAPCLRQFVRVVSCIACTNSCAFSHDYTDAKPQGCIQAHPAAGRSAGVRRRHIRVERVRLARHPQDLDGASLSSAFILHDWRRLWRLLAHHVL